MSRLSHTRESDNEYKSSFTPRSLAHGKTGRVVPLKQKKRISYFIYMILMVGGLVLVGSIINKIDWLSILNKQEPDQRSPLVLNENPEIGPTIEEGDEEDPKYGQRLIVSNVNKLTISVRAVRGESTLFIGRTGNEKMVLREGDQKVIEGDQVWFRLGKPSNVDILINNKLVTTRAQDQEKSYYILKKQL